jgi:hypothetical protein
VYGDFLHNFEDTLNHITSNIVPNFRGLEWFVQYLASRGENPVSFIETLVSRIAGRAYPVTVLQELVDGVMLYGLEGFAQAKAHEAIKPVINTLNTHSNTGNQLAALHQNTITTLHTKINALTSGNTTSGMAFTGDAATSMQASLSTLTNKLNQASSLLGSPQDQINRDFSNAIATYVAGAVALDLAILSVEAIVSLAGITIPAEVVLDGGVILVEVLGLIGLVVIEGAIWIGRTVTLHSQQQSFDSSQSQSTVSYGLPHSWQDTGGKIKVPPPNDQYPGAFRAALMAALSAAAGYGAHILSEKFLSLAQSEQNQLFSDLANAYGISPAALAAYLNYCLQKNPDATVQQLLDALSVRSVMVRDQMLIDDVNTRINDPRYVDAKPSLQDFIKALQANIKVLKDQETKILGENYGQLALNPNKWNPFQNMVNSAGNFFKGSYATWVVAKDYGDQGKLVFIDKFLGRDGNKRREIDLGVRDGNSIRFLQVKAYSNSFSSASKSYDKDVVPNIQLTYSAANDSNVIKTLQREHKWFDGKVTGVEVDIADVKGANDWHDLDKRIHSDFPSSNSAFQPPIEVHTSTNPPSSDIDYKRNPNNPFYDPSVNTKFKHLDALPNGWDPMSVGPVDKPKTAPSSSPTPQPVPTAVTTPTP